MKPAETQCEHLLMAEGSKLLRADEVLFGGSLFIYGNSEDVKSVCDIKLKKPQFLTLEE